MRSMRDLWPEAPSIVILTGAGISQESGLATFRDADGIWATVRLEEVATPEAFARDPARVLAFYNARRRQLQHPSVTPNAAHEALARLEAVRPGEVMIATQNIDDLHERAGSRAVIHMHGELLKARCTACGKTTVWYDDLTGNEGCPICAIEGQLRPHVVWFGEMPLRLDAIYQVLAAVQGLRLDRHLGQRRAGGELCRRGPPRRRPHGRAQPRTLAQRQPLCRTDLRSGQSDRAGICREPADGNG